MGPPGPGSADVLNLAITEPEVTNTSAANVSHRVRNVRNVSDRVLRFNGNDWAIASHGNEFDDLIGLVFKTKDEFHLAGSIINGLNNVEAGTIYYLGTDGYLTNRPPDSGFIVVLGKGIGDGSLMFTPMLPVEPAAFQLLRTGSPVLVTTASE